MLGVSSEHHLVLGGPRFWMSLFGTTWSIIHSTPPGDELIRTVGAHGTTRTASAETRTAYAGCEYGTANGCHMSVNVPSS